MPASVALIDVTTQACRPASEDLIDDRVLLPAPLGGGPGREPALEVPLEDLRDLVSRSLAHLLADHHLRTQRIQWTSRRAHALRRHVRVDRRRPERPMTEQRLDHP